MKPNAFSPSLPFLQLVFSLAIANVASGQSNAAEIRLSFAPDAHIVSAQVNSEDLIDVYVLSSGADFDFSFIAFDLRYPYLQLLPGITWSDGVEVSSLCDSPPINWCLFPYFAPDYCANSADYPYIVRQTFLVNGDVEPNTTICLDTAQRWWFQTIEGPGYSTCTGEEVDFAIATHPDLPELPGCLVFNPDPVAVESSSMSRIKALY